MILEIADIEITKGKNTEFEAAVGKAAAIFAQAQGALSMELHRMVEEPERYRLFVRWETLEDHTETFRNSDGFTGWRALVGSYFARPPRVDHSETVFSKDFGH